jgi:hypothetical protein
MPISLIRGLLGLLCIFFAHFLGRSIVRFRQGKEPRSRVIHWALRAVATGAGVLWRGLDTISLVVLGLAVVSLLAGLRLETRPRQVDHLEKQMFPPE